MIKLENVVLASPEQMEFIIQGMRNPINSWEKSDSILVIDGEQFDIFGNSKEYGCEVTDTDTFFELGNNDWKLMQQLYRGGTDHRKFMRMMPVYVRITAPLYWWKEFDTYKVGTIANSCSTMHKIQEKEFTLDDFSCEHLISDWIGDNNDAIWYKDQPKNGSIECPIIFSPLDALRITIGVLNTNREAYLKTKDKKFWWQMIQLLPSSYNQTRNIMMNYEVLANTYKSRKDHKLDEWREFCKWIESLPYSELIVGEQNSKPMTPDEINTLVDIQKKRFGEPFPWIKEKIEKVASELHSMVDGCPCKGCSDLTRAYCKSETCEKYSEWFSKLKEE